jgi:hypothetical protein
MTSLLYQNTLARAVEQNIPDQLRFKTMKNEDVIVSRSKWKVQPSSSATEYGSGVGANANIQKLLQFKIVSDKWLDPQTLRLTGRVQTGGTGIVTTDIFTVSAGKSYLYPNGDGVDSLFKNVRTDLASREFENIDNYNVLFPNLLTVASCPKDYYNSSCTVSGYWKYLEKSPVNMQNAVIPDATDSVLGAAPAASVVAAMANGNRANTFNSRLYITQMYDDGFDFSVPLHLGLFRTGTFLAPRMPIEIQITMEDVGIAFTKVGAATDTFYKIINPVILVDQVEVHSDYMQKYNEVIASSGLSLECDVYTCVSNTVPNSNNAYFNINRGISRLRSIYSVMLDPTAGASKLSRFISNNFQSIKHTINGVSYPSSDGIVGYSQAWDALQQSLNQLNDYNSSTLLDYNKYTGKNYGWYAANTDETAFVIGLDFQRSDSRASGVDTAVQGGVIKVEMTASPAMPTATTMLSFIHFDRQLKIKNDGIMLFE